LTAPRIVNEPINSRIFETWIETQLVPTLSPGDVVILDNVDFHKSERAEQLVKAKGAWLLLLPPYSQDLNPIEMAFSKLKALLRKRAAGPSMPSHKPSATSSASSQSVNAETSSGLLGMRQNDVTGFSVNVLFDARRERVLDLSHTPIDGYFRTGGKTALFTGKEEGCCCHLVRSTHAPKGDHTGQCVSNFL
jgi:hypothetical protein